MEGEQTIEQGKGNKGNGKIPEPQGRNIDAEVSERAEKLAATMLTAEVDKAIAAYRATLHKDNPWENVFERVEFSTGDGQIFTNEKRPQDGKSKRAANVSFVFVGGIGSVSGTVYLVLLPGAKIPQVDVRFASGGSFKKMITPLSDASRDSLTAYRQNVGRDYVKWRNAQQAAGAKTVGQPSASSSLVSDDSLAGESFA